jgi:hypothetical protein
MRCQGRTAGTGGAPGRTERHKFGGLPHRGGQAADDQRLRGSGIGGGGGGHRGPPVCGDRRSRSLTLATNGLDAIRHHRRRRIRRRMSPGRVRGDKSRSLLASDPTASANPRQPCRPRLVADELPRARPASTHGPAHPRQRRPDGRAFMPWPWSVHEPRTSSAGSRCAREAWRWSVRARATRIRPPPGTSDVEDFGDLVDRLRRRRTSVRRRPCAVCTQGELVLLGKGDGYGCAASRGELALATRAKASTRGEVDGSARRGRPGGARCQSSMAW